MNAIEICKRVSQIMKDDDFDNFDGEYIKKELLDKFDLMADFILQDDQLSMGQYRSIKIFIKKSFLFAHLTDMQVVSNDDLDSVKQQISNYAKMRGH